jgi:hypothetical protein
MDAFHRSSRRVRAGRLANEHCEREAAEAEADVAEELSAGAEEEFLFDGVHVFSYHGFLTRVFFCVTRTRVENP